MKITLSILFSFILALAQAGTFSVKLQVELVDHSSVDGTTIEAYDDQESVANERLDESGEIKLRLEEGRLYTVWIKKDGFIPHVIHNVHDQGDGKFKVTLYKRTKEYQHDAQGYGMANRVFDKVKDLEVSGDALDRPLHFVDKEALTETEAALLKSIQKIGNEQVSIQKKIDGLNADIEKYEKKLSETDIELEEGKIEKLEAEEKKLSLQEDIVKAQKKIEKLSY